MFGDKRDLEGRRALLVEDIEKTLSGTIAELRSAGLEITVTSNSADAIVALEATTFDVVLLDWRLPLTVDSAPDDEGGLRVLEALSSAACTGNAGVPVIIVTNQGSSVDSVRLSTFGNYRATLSKLQMDEITRAVRSVLHEPVSGGGRSV